MRSKRYMLVLAAVSVVYGLSEWSLASDARTSAQAGSGRGRSGTAAATAHYEGDVGFARTDSRTGRVNVARGVALGVDEDGLSFSLSTAVAPRNGPALATNFNVSIGTNGEVATSVGRAVASGGAERSVSAGGGSSSGDRFRSGSAVSQASGRTSFGGVVRAQTSSHHEPAPVVRRVIVRR